MINWDAIGAIGEIVSGIAVIATLVYLSIQVKLARKATMAQIYQARADASSRSNIAAKSMYKAAQMLQEDRLSRREVWEALTLDEKAGIRAYFWEYMFRLDNNYAQYRMGFLDESNYEQFVENPVRSTKADREFHGIKLENFAVSSEFIELVRQLDEDSA